MEREIFGFTYGRGRRGLDVCLASTGEPVEDAALKVRDEVDGQWFEVLEILAPGSLLIHY